MSLEVPQDRKRHVSEAREDQMDAQEAMALLDHICKLDIYSDPKSHRLTSIICTLGPASRSDSVLTDLVKSGMNIARLNFSHGTHEYHAETIASVRKVVNALKKSVAIALDTKGPEIRLGLLKGGGSAEVELKRGNRVTLTTDASMKESGTADRVYIDYKNIVKVVDIGGTIYVDDGLISLIVKEKGSDYLTCEIDNGGMLGSRKGVNLPHADVDLPAVSEQDRRDLLFGVDQNVDMVFASFIRKADDVKEVRGILGEKGKDILIVSKIENHEGMRNFDEILDASDGIMVARGDLGIEIPAEKVFLAQKMMVGRCNRAGKPVICATQMLDSMISNPRPTRAEGSDVANAVLDGVDCIMLSGETAKGKYPVQSVQMMHNISREAEAAMFHRLVFDEIKRGSTGDRDMMRAVAVAAISATFELNAGAIVCLTKTGRTAQILSNFRPRAGILTVTRNARVARQIHLWRGCFPLYYDKPVIEPWEEDAEARVQWALTRGKEMGFLKVGTPVVIVQGFRPGPFATNTIRILQTP